MYRIQAFDSSRKSVGAITSSTCITKLPAVSRTVRHSSTISVLIYFHSISFAKGPSVYLSRGSTVKDTKRISCLPRLRFSTRKLKSAYIPGYLYRKRQGQAYSLMVVFLNSLCTSPHSWPTRLDHLDFLLVSQTPGFKGAVYLEILQNPRVISCFLSTCGQYPAYCE